MKNLLGDKSNTALFLLFFISLITIYNAYYPRYSVTLERVFKLTTKVTYENRDPNKVWLLRDDEVTIGLFMNNSWQKAYLVGTSHPIKRFYNDSDGNPVILLDIGDMRVPPWGKVSYNVTYRLIYREREPPAILEDLSGDLDDIPRELREEYCKPTSLWHFNGTALAPLAKEIAGDERRVLTILRRFIEWIISNIQYATSEVPRYPNETISQRLGDCDDQANLLITLCRAVGIPAFLQVGCIYIPELNESLLYWSGHLFIREVRVGWHGWAIVYVPPWGWLPVDLTYVSADLIYNPLSAITHSAIIEHYTFQYSNITVTDYISELMSIKKFIEGNMFYIYEEDLMEFRLEEKVMYQRLPLIKPIYLAVLIPKLVFRHGA
ncbi:MAG: transglutaminase-like domain-containing protein [Candidatus Bathyarchaeia archaeon]